MKRYFNLIDTTDNNYCDVIDSSYMIEIPDDGKPYGLINSELMDISETDEYKLKIKTLENNIKKASLQAQITELDLKSIRALREGGFKDETTGQTWVDFYTNQIQALRNEIATL